MSVAKPTAGRSPLVAAARSLLSQRYARLRRAARRCAAAIEQPESVHQLRVATRRMDAALSLFSPLLPPRRGRKLQKRLRRARRAARIVRDCDVLLERLHAAPTAPGPMVAAQPAGASESGCGNGFPGDVNTAGVIAALRSRRATAADSLLPELSDLMGKRGKQRWRRLRDSLRWRVAEPEAGFAEGLRRLAAPALAALEQAGASDLTDVSALHRFRLAAKRARYTLEVLRDASEAEQTLALEEWLKRCQQQLGDINDHATAAVLLNELAARGNHDGVRCAAAKLGAAERLRLQEGALRFAGWWRATGRQEAARTLEALRSGWGA